MLSWGLANPLSDIAVDQLSVGAMFAIEIASGTFILTVIGLLRRSLSFAHWRWALAFGLLEPGLTYLFGNLGYANGTVSTGLIIMQSEVIFLAIFGWLWMKEKIGQREIVGILLGTFGASLVGWAATSENVGDWTSTFAFLLAALAAAGYAAAIRKFAMLVPNANMFAVVWLQCIVSLAIAVVALPVTSQLGTTAATADLTAISAAIGAGIFGVAIPFVLFSWASTVVPSRHAALALNLIPVAGITIGAFLGRGLPTGLQYIGGALVLLSLFAMQTQQNA
jgi:drug/metabolite transporter (DMT)-like permease